MRRSGIWWLAGVSAAFSLAVLLFTPLRVGLGWDESVYASQISQHVPILPWAAPRARGVPLLVAPVTLATGSVLTLRVYLGLMSGVGMFLALLAWRGLRSSLQLALAGLVFGAIWISQIESTQVMGHLWVAFSALAAVGLFVRYVSTGNRRLIAALVLSVALSALFNGPTDGVFIAVPMLAAALVVRGWRRYWLSAVGAVGAGLAIAIGEWAAEAWLYFGGPVARMHSTAGQGAGFGFYLGRYLATLDGGGNRPSATAWWIALAVVIAAGLWADRRAGGLAWRSAVLAVLCGLADLTQFALFLPLAWPRYLLPTLALMSVPAADGLAWLARGASQQARSGTGLARLARGAGTAVVAAFLAAGLVAQHLILGHGTTREEGKAAWVASVVQDLRLLGVRPGCNLITASGIDSMPVAYYAECHQVRATPGTLATVAESNRDGQPIVLLNKRIQPPGGLAHWTEIGLSGTAVAAYIPAAAAARQKP